MPNKLDLNESEDDKKHLLPEEAILDLPDVSDIPGQENVRPPFLGEMGDTTASSADEEGDELFDDPLDSSLADVSVLERRDLRKSASQTPGDESEADVRGAALDRLDNEGDALNEGNLITDRFGEDMDLPESEEVNEEDSE